jgi:hypothetical protein
VCAAAGALLAAWGYNVLAGAGLGLEVDLDSEVGPISSR